ncbi:branched-chain amino acid transport system II carrier protein [Paenimyroides tangerinum]|uniref:Branched-chain amino acid transport system II carrier protein n=1 Tax=Paenimyroides tangerinum TaxID=2488728 RepID=A0A3P3W4U3_9FLAO|nr:branched-chain amino acid transport system II carrier protein [Paenimyroides tangerinum]RRJ89438.1 branched-chain amino acid transport system II carrier protein [Paenimyroides tangerinum]
MQNKSIMVILTLGFALFAMFFGAGNLILPPYIGLLAKDNWVEAILGFTTSGIIAPFLGIIAVLKSGDSFTDLGKRVNLKLALVLATIIMLCIGPIVAIPRTGATTFEVGVLPLMPDASPIWSSIIFFAIVLVLSISPSKIVDIIGSYLTPLLLILLATLVVVGILNPAVIPQSSNIGASQDFAMAFQEGYQTMDVLASVIFAGIIISAARQKGFVNLKERTNIVLKSGLLAMGCLLFIYGGLIYLGATTDYQFTETSSRTQLLLHISTSVIGEYGTLAISVSMALACLTTAIALTCAVGTFFAELTNNKFGYAEAVISCTLVSALFSINSVDDIINYAGSILGFVYPITFALVIYVVLFGNKITQKLPYVVALLITTFISAFRVLAHFNIATTEINYYKEFIPLGSHNLEWVIPSFIGFIITYFITKNSSKKFVTT